MAKAVINDKDIYNGSGDPLKAVRNSLIELDKIISANKQNASTLSDQFKKLSEVTKLNSNSIKEFTKAKKEADKINKELIQQEKLKLQLEQQKEKKQQQNLKTQQEKEKLDQQTIRTKKAKLQLDKQLEKQQKDLNSAYKIESKRLTDLRNKAKDLAITLGEDSKEFKRAKKEVSALDKKLKRIDETLGQSQREVGKYENAWRGVRKTLAKGLGFLGITAGLMALKNALQQAINISKEFELRLSTLEAVTGASEKQLKKLENQAKFLGRTTQRSASQVADLQIELAKLGFGTEQIEASTEGILRLSIATGEGLAESAKIAAGVMNAFQMEASEVANIVDVMAASFTNSALDLEKFKFAIAPVAPVANQAGVALEEVTATLGILVDRNIDASTAGTALRNIYLRLAEQGLTLDEAMKKINTSTNANATALELFGTRGASVASIMAASQEEIAKLTLTLENSAGAAEAMAEILADNLEGSIQSSKSALEGLQIALGERMNESFRNAVDGFTNLISSITEFVQIKPSEELEDQQMQVQLLGQRLFDSNLSQKETNKLLIQLKRINPDIVKGLQAQNINYELLRLNLNKFNEELQRNILISKADEAITEKRNKVNEIAGDLSEERIELLKTLRKAINQLSDIDNNAGLKAQSIADDINISLEERARIIRELIFETRKFNAQGVEVAKTGNELKENIRLSSIEIFRLKEAQEELLLVEQAREEVLRAIYGERGAPIELGETPDISTPEIQVDETTFEEYEQFLKNFNSEIDKQLNEIITKEEQGIIELTKKQIDAIKELKKVQEGIADFDIKTILDPYEKAIEEEKILFQQRLIDFGINEDQLLAKAREGAEKLTETERAKLELIKLLREEFNLRQDEIQIERDLQRNNLDAIEIQNQIAKEGVLFKNTENHFSRLKELEVQRFQTSLELLKGNQLAIEEETLKHNQNLAELENQKLQNQQQGYQTFKSTVIDQISTNLNTLTQLQQAKNNEQIASLERRYDREREAAQGNAEELARIDAREAAEKERINREFQRKQRELAVIQAIIQGALAVQNALATVVPFPLALIAAGTAAAASAVQIRLIRSQPLEDGGMIEGALHKDGGVPTYVGNEDRPSYEVEGGEYVINRKSTKKSISTIEKINTHKWSDKEIIPAMDMYRKMNNLNIRNDVDIDLTEMIAEQKRTNEMLNGFKAIAVDKDGKFHIMDLQGNKTILKE